MMFIPLIQCWCEIKYLRTSFEITQFCPRVQKDKCVGMMSVYFCPHSVFNSGYLIEFVCLKIDLIGISYNWVYLAWDTIA